MTDRIVRRPVADKDVYSATASWGERAEALAARWLALIARLQTIDLAFTGWMHRDERLARVPFDPRLDAQVARVLAGTDRHVTGRLAPEAGSRLGNLTDPDQPSRYLDVDMCAGAYGPYSNNYVGAGTNSYAVPEPRLVTYRVFRGVLLALAETFEVTQAYAWSSDLAKLWRRDEGDFRAVSLAWIVYIAPRFAHLVTPPPAAVVERRPDGGLLMAATNEVFTITNPAHLQAARAMEAALEPFNAVPWTPESGK